MFSLPVNRWLAASFGITGALIVALHLPISGWGFCVFLCSSILWIIAAYRMRDRAILMETSVYTVINIIGIWRWVLS